jgi:hypothetical protein
MRAANARRIRCSSGANDHARVRARLHVYRECAFTRAFDDVYLLTLAFACVNDRLRSASIGFIAT